MPPTAWRSTKQLQMLNAIDRFEDAKRKVRMAANRLQAGLHLVRQSRPGIDQPDDYSKFDPDKVARQRRGCSSTCRWTACRHGNAYRRELVNFESELRDFTLALGQPEREHRAAACGRWSSAGRTMRSRRTPSAGQPPRRKHHPAAAKPAAPRCATWWTPRTAQISAQNAVIAALVDYQQTRLQLMLDIGALDTETAQVLAARTTSPASCPPTTPTAARPHARPESKPLIPPERTLTQLTMNSLDSLPIGSCAT